MSEEEKKAVELLKQTIDQNSSMYIDDLGDNDIIKILKLIEKQQQEIEQLKNLYSDEKIRNTIIKKYRDVIEKDYISKDKIRELKQKVEEEMINNPYDFSYMIQELLEE